MFSKFPPIPGAHLSKVGIAHLHDASPHSELEPHREVYQWSIERPMNLKRLLTVYSSWRRNSWVEFLPGGPERSRRAEGWRTTTSVEYQCLRWVLQLYCAVIHRWKRVIQRAPSTSFRKHHFLQSSTKTCGWKNSLLEPYRALCSLSYRITRWMHGGGVLENKSAIVLTYWSTSALGYFSGVINRIPAVSFGLLAEKSQFFSFWSLFSAFW